LKELALHILDIVQNSIQAEANRIHIQIEEDTQKDLLKITISDNGKGMDQAFLKRVTDPFHDDKDHTPRGIGFTVNKTGGD
jgi:signal transduction histidine kinase